MKLQFDIADRLRTVEVYRDTLGYRVVVDGRVRLVDAVRVVGDTWSLIVRDEAYGGSAASVTAVVARDPGNEALDVRVRGHQIAVRPRVGHGRRARDQAGATGHGPQRVTAPMPGKVVRVLVEPGDEVAARQGLAVVEAMKMENELRAVRAGRVRDVFVREGQSVDAGTPLVVVE